MASDSEDEHNEDTLFSDEDEYEVELSEGVFVTKLTKMVRKSYTAFLEKMLNENYDKWSSQRQNCELEAQVKKAAILECTSQLEDRVFNTCLVMEIYQRNMLKVMANIRNKTAKRSLQSHLEQLLKGGKCTKTQEKGIQTDAESCSPKQQQFAQVEEKSKFASLDERLEIMLNSAPATEISETVLRGIKRKNEELNTSTSSTITPNKKKYAPPPKTQLPPVAHVSPMKHVKAELNATSPNSAVLDYSTYVSPATPSVYYNTPLMQDDVAATPADAADEVAKAMEQIFSEEQSDFDQLFGLKPSKEPDDPQIKCILKEIEAAEPAGARKNTTNKLTPTTPAAAATLQKPHANNKHLNVPLQHSIWPCELYRQRRRLSKALDFPMATTSLRVCEMMKNRFEQLFGEDSDDEFAVCSPSIELTQELINSCVKRISHWVVKHLMPALRDGLVGNRFLFKKLAKKLAHSIIFENQYPDENYVKNAVADYFYQHGHVLTCEDLERAFGGTV